jgi:hypothetical protein
LAAASQEEHAFFVAQDARSREEAARETVRRRIIVRSVGWKRLTTKPRAFRKGPSAYLDACIGGAGGGGGGLEAQETTTIEAARARSAYFIV